MKVGIDIRNIGKKRTGDEVVFFNLVKNLMSIDNKNEYFLFTDILDEKNITEIKKDLGIKNGSNFQIIPLKSPNKFVWNIWTLPKYLRKNPIDIYQTQYITPWFVSRSIKIITTIHDISFNFYPQFINLFDLLFLKFLIPISLKRADKIIAVSKFTADEIIRYYKIDREKIIWIHNAVSEDFLKELSEEEKEKVKKKYNLPEKFILYLGTMQPRKNIPRLIEAFARIKSSVAGMKLVLCGNQKAHNFDKRIGETVEKMGLEKDIDFLGYVSNKDKQAIFSLAYVFVFPSLYEGFGIPILEAMAAGIPVLASQITPHEEIAGKSILFFDVNDNYDLGNKLKEICLDDNLRRNLLTKEAEQIKKFSWRESSIKIFHIYGKLSDPLSH